jgi:arginase family enzyme
LILIIDEAHTETSTNLAQEVIDLIKDNNKAEAVAKYCNELKNKISESLENCCKPIIIGGDHSITLGSVSSVNEFIKKNEKLLFIAFFVEKSYNTSNEYF